MIEEIARATAELDLVDWVKLYLIVLIAGSISAAITYEITYRTDKHSKSRNSKQEEKDNE